MNRSIDSKTYELLPNFNHRGLLTLSPWLYQNACTCVGDHVEYVDVGVAQTPAKRPEAVFEEHKVHAILAHAKHTDE